MTDNENRPPDNGSTPTKATKPVDGTDPRDLSLDNPAQDRVDRSVITNQWMRGLARASLRFVAVAIGLVVMFTAIKYLWAGILPIILALIVCTVLAPAAGWLRRHRFSDTWAAIASILVFFGIFGAVIGFLAPDVIRQSRLLYLQAIEGILRLQLWAQGPPLNLNGSDLDQVINDSSKWAQGKAGDIAGGVVSGISTATSVAFTLFMVFVLTVFFLRDGHKFLPWLRNILGRRAGWHSTELLTRCWRTLGGFIQAQAAVSTCDSTFIGIGLWLMGVPMAFTLALVTFISGFIPYIGTIIGGGLAVLVALVSDGFTKALLVVVLVTAVNVIDGNVLSPVLQSRAMNLHPVIVLVSVVIGGGLLGVMGGFLAVPIAATIAVILRYITDILSLYAGEKKAKEIDFITPEGRSIGLMSEEQGKVVRNQWREHEKEMARAEAKISADTSPAPAQQIDEDPAVHKPSMLRRGNELFERLIGDKD